MDFLYNNLEMVVAIVGGVSIFGVLFFSKSKGTGNDLTYLYIKHKKHTDNINKSTKSIF